MPPTPLSRRDRLAQIWPTVRLIRRAAGGWLVAWTGLLVLQGLVPVATVYLTKPLVDALQLAVGAGLDGAAVSRLVTYGVAMAALLLLTEILKVAQQWVGFVQSTLVTDHVVDLIHEQATRVDAAAYESPEFLDSLYRVRADAANRPLSMLEGLGSLLQNVVTVLGIGALLVTYGLWVALVLLAGTIPTFLVVLRSSRQYHAWWTETTTERRRSDYFSQVLTDATAAPEVRLYSLGDTLRARYRAIRNRLRDARFRLLRRQGIARFGAELVALGVTGGTLVWMLLRALRGLATLGDIALFYQAFQRGQALVRGLFNNINQLHSNSLFLHDLHEFLALLPRIVAPERPQPLSAPLREGIEFRDVTFRYPGVDRPALDRCRLHIPAGRLVAIVGANGAGKSTLLKLLARFYDPDEGVVALDGVDLREVDPVALHGLMTVMVQSPMRYQGSVEENIALGAAGAAPDERRLRGVAEQAGAEALIARLEAGYRTLLGRLFPGGVELSGGEWQRLVLARALYRGTPLLVMDEPTSHLDAWAEDEWIDHLRRVTQGSTVLVVTHRLSIARRADLIHVMDAGRVIESGTHEALVAAGGRYAALWTGDEAEAGLAE